MVFHRQILFLPAWYPNKKHSSIGSFIRTHAEALNKQTKVDVLHVCGDEDLKNKLYKFEYQQVNGLDTYIIYYKKNKTKHPLAQFSKALLYVIGQFYGYYLYRKLKPRPEFFHVHVLTRTAILPFVFNLLLGRKYFISEHWSRYLSADNNYKGFIRKYLTKIILKKSQGISAVSIFLGKAMQNHGLIHNNFKIIPNISSNDFINFKADVKIENNYYIHVSNFDKRSKNILGLLNIINILKQRGFPIFLKMIGDGDDFENAKKFVHDNQLENVIFFGFLHKEELVSEMKNAKALLLFSWYETQSVATIEAHSLGIPVITTDAGGVAELINENNGILVPNTDEEAMIKAILQIENGEKSFDREQIRAEAVARFCADSVVQQFLDFYYKGLNLFVK